MPNRQVSNGSYGASRTSSFQSRTSFSEHINTHVNASPGRISAMIRVLRSSSDPRARWKARKELIIMGEAAVPYLVKAANDKNHNVRHNAILALGELGGDSAVQALMKILLNKDPKMRSDAAMALGWTGDPSVITDMNLQLKDEEDKNVRIRILEAVGRLSLLK